MDVEVEAEPVEELLDLEDEVEAEPEEELLDLEDEVEAEPDEALVESAIVSDKASSAVEDATIVVTDALVVSA